MDPSLLNRFSQPPRPGGSGNPSGLSGADDSVMSLDLLLTMPSASGLSAASVTAGAGIHHPHKLAVGNPHLPSLVNMITQSGVTATSQIQTGGGGSIPVTGSGSRLRGNIVGGSFLTDSALVPSIACQQSSALEPLLLEGLSAGHRGFANVASSMPSHLSPMHPLTLTGVKTSPNDSNSIDSVPPGLSGVLVHNRPLSVCSQPQISPVSSLGNGDRVRHLSGGEISPSSASGSIGERKGSSGPATSSCSGDRHGFNIGRGHAIGPRSGSLKSNAARLGSLSALPTTSSNAAAAAAAAAGFRNRRITHMCDICKKEFHNSSAFAKHKITHQDERKYQCDKCGKNFKRQDHLNGHKLVHEEKKPHACRFCDKSYADSRSLHRHYANTHTDQYHSWQRDEESRRKEGRAVDPSNPLSVSAMYRCSECDKLFRSQAALNGHMRLHGGYIRGSEEAGSAVSGEVSDHTGDDMSPPTLSLKTELSPKMNTPGGLAFRHPSPQQQLIPISLQQQQAHQQQQQQAQQQSQQEIDDDSPDAMTNVLRALQKRENATHATTSAGENFASNIVSPSSHQGGFSLPLMKENTPMVTSSWNELSSTPLASSSPVRDIPQSTFRLGTILPPDRNRSVSQSDNAVTTDLSTDSISKIIEHMSDPLPPVNLAQSNLAWQQQAVAMVQQMASAANRAEQADRHSPQESFQQHQRQQQAQQQRQSQQDDHQRESPQPPHPSDQQAQEQQQQQQQFSPITPAYDERPGGSGGKRMTFPPPPELLHGESPVSVEVVVSSASPACGGAGDNDPALGDLNLPIVGEADLNQMMSEHPFSDFSDLLQEHPGGGSPLFRGGQSVNDEGGLHDTLSTPPSVSLLAMRQRTAHPAHNTGLSASTLSPEPSTITLAGGSSGGVSGASLVCSTGGNSLITSSDSIVAVSPLSGAHQGPHLVSSMQREDTMPVLTPQNSLLIAENSAFQPVGNTMCSAPPPILQQQIPTGQTSVVVNLVTQRREVGEIELPGSNHEDITSPPVLPPAASVASIMKTSPHSTTLDLSSTITTSANPMFFIKTSPTCEKQAPQTFTFKCRDETLMSQDTIILRDHQGSDLSGHVKAEVLSPVVRPLHGSLPQFLSKSWGGSRPTDALPRALEMGGEETHMDVSPGATTSAGGGASDGFLPPLPGPPSTSLRKRNRPAPLIIPPAAATSASRGLGGSGSASLGYMSHMRSPRLWDPSASAPSLGSSEQPAYTPPPMLSPVRKGSGLFFNLFVGAGAPRSAPVTSKQLSNLQGPQAISCRRRASGGEAPSVTEAEGGVPERMARDELELSLELEESEVKDERSVEEVMAAEMAGDEDMVNEQNLEAVSTEPHINIGEHFQAVLPDFLEGGVNEEYMNSSAHADRIWDPSCLHGEDDEQLQRYLKVSCSAAVRESGLNVEYAFHLLYQARGDFKEATINLLKESFAFTVPLRCLNNYHYAETELWSNREIQLFAQSLVRHEKDFFLISRDLHEQYGISKSVKACVEFYYLWKMSGSEDYRRVRHQRRKKNRETALPPAPAAPACPPGDMDSQYNLRRRGGAGECEHCGLSFATARQLDAHIAVCCAAQDLGLDLLSAAVSNSPRSNNSRSVSPVPPDSEGSLLETSSESVGFPCRLCGKVFYKVKSRNAHMKWHSEKARAESSL